MHEFAIGESLVAAVLAEVERLPTPPSSVARVRVVAGALRQVLPEHLAFAFDLLARETLAAGAALEVTALPVVVRCTVCNWQGEVPELMILCQACGAVEVHVEQGMELHLDQIEVEYDGGASD